jgi:hypothetical protein
LVEAAVTKPSLITTFSHTLRGVYLKRHRRKYPDEPWATVRELIIEDHAAERDDHIEAAPHVIAFVTS